MAGTLGKIYAVLVIISLSEPRCLGRGSRWRPLLMPYSEEEMKLIEKEVEAVERDRCGKQEAKHDDITPKNIDSLHQQYKENSERLQLKILPNNARFSRFLSTAEMKALTDTGTERIKIKFSKEASRQKQGFSNHGDMVLQEGSLQDENYSQFYLLTRSGYEYHGSNTTLKSAILASRRLHQKTNSKGRGFLDPSAPNDVEEEFPKSNLKTVYPPDTRTKVANTITFPWSGVGQLHSGCTGTFISPRHILTAGHCVYNPGNGKWSSNLNFKRAKTCDPNAGVTHGWKYAITVKGWKLGLPAYDFALVAVDRPSPVWMDIGWYDEAPHGTPPNLAISMNGYPIDKPYNCMWHSNCTVQEVSTWQLGYTCDTHSGMSGSSVYSNFPGSRAALKVICIHAYGGDSSSPLNKCTKITALKYYLLKKWMMDYS